MRAKTFAKEHQMKSIIKSVLVSALLVTLAATAASGKARRSSIALSSDTNVNGTVVKKGNYQAVYDDQSGELAIFKGKKLLVKTAARVEKREQKARGTEVQTVLAGVEQKLVGVAFGGSYENVIVGQAGMQGGGN
jgi:hypothetical protein